MSHRYEPMAIGRLRMAFMLSLAILLAEILGGFASHSLALLADAGHLLTDIFSLGLAWFAAVQALRPADARRTYGYHRIGILVALVNAVALVVISIFIGFEAYHRLSIEEPVSGPIMLAIAAFALVLNLVVAFSLSEASGQNLNVRSALLHVVGDAAASAGVLVAGITIALTAIYRLDPIVSLVISVLICIGAWRIIGQAVRILLEESPASVNMAEMVRQILHVPGVKDVHDLHVWSISNDMTALSCHVLMEDRRTSELTTTLAEMKALLHQRFGVCHSTIEVECEGCEIDNAFCSLEEHEHASSSA